MSAAKPNVISFDFVDMVCDDSATQVKLKATTFPLMVQVNMPCNPPVRFKVPDGPNAKASFDDYIDECKVKAKKWATDDAMFKVYKQLGGASAFDTYQTNLQLFFHHTLNSHVFGLTTTDNSSTLDERGDALHPSRQAAEEAFMRSANKNEAEFDRIFRSVDAVHAYT